MRLTDTQRQLLAAAAQQAAVAERELRIIATAIAGSAGWEYDKSTGELHTAEELGEITEDEVE